MTRTPGLTGEARPAVRAADGDPMLSRGEIEALCAKAARGAGMAWGLAEEAGYAAGWLSVHGIDGPRALIEHLTWAQGLSWQEICPTVAAGMWTACDGGTLCPVALGATLCDFCTLPDAALTGRGLTIGPVSRPVILLPFLAAMAQRLGHPIDVSWPEGGVAIAPTGGIAGEVTGLVALDRAQVILRRCAELPDAAPPGRRRECSRDTIARLDALALKVTVPSSGTSRVDAGAGDNDND